MFNLTPTERAILTADNVEFSAGLELLDDDNRLVEDISDDLVSGQIDYDNFTTVHGSCRLSITRRLRWGRDRVRPYVVASRFDGYEAVADVEVVGETVNLCTNPSFEVDTAGWIGRAGSEGLTLSTTRALSGATSLRATFSGSGSGVYYLGADATGTLRGQTVVAAAWVWVPVGTTVRAYLYDTTSAFRAGTAAVGNDDWQRIEVAGTFDSGARQNLYVRCESTDAPRDVWVDAVLIAEGATVPDYFDGDSPSTGTYDYGWTGTPHASTSVRRELSTTYRQVEQHASVRINQGVYLLTTPREERGEDPQTFDVTGYNLLHLLQDGPGETYMVTAGTTYLQAVRDVLTAAGVTVPLFMDGSLQATTLPATRTWCLTDGASSWLSIVDDLLDEINYANLWADRDGSFRSAPYMDPATRPSEHTFDTTDPGTNIVHHDRVVTEDVATAVNWWRFVRSGLEYQPFDGDGIYEPAVNATDPDETALGRIVRRVVFLDAANQASLVAQGDRIVIEDTQVTRSVDLTIDPFPALGHADVVELIDGGVREKLPVASWSLSLSGEPGPLRLGGLPKPTPERREQQVKATVVTTSPLTVVVDGAEVATPAATLDGWTATGIGQRITVTVRTPQLPLVNGEET